MFTYKQIHHTKLMQILSQAALGIAAITGRDYIVSDMVYALHALPAGYPYYIAIRESGVEHGYYSDCLSACKTLGYPIVLVKITADRNIDFNITIMFTKLREGSNNEDLENEFKTLKQWEQSK